MNFYEDNELDYEEDDLENDFVKNDCESKNSAEDETNENSEISGLDDQRKVSCPEEEENFMEWITIDSESTKSQNDTKDEEESEKVNSKKLQSRKEQCTQTNNSNENNKNNNGNSHNKCSVNEKKIYRKRKRSFQRRLGIKKPPTNFFTINPLLPKWNFSSVFNKDILNLSQNLHSNSSPQFSSLELKAAEVEQTLPQLMRISDRKLFHENVNADIVRNKNFKNSLSAQDLSSAFREFVDNYQFRERKNNFQHRTFYGQDDNSADTDIKNYDEENTKNILNRLYNSLKDDEKELVRLKKEARLKRFMSDDIIRKERELINLSENVSKDNLNSEADYFQKLKEQKFTRGKLLSLKEHQRKNSNFDTDKNCAVETPDINKEFLLKKKNPFDANLRNPNCLLTNVIKQEREIKQECPKKGQFSPQGLYVVRNGTDSSVKFVRTVSKSFDELSLRKFKTNVLENKNEKNESLSLNSVTTLPFVAESKINYSTDFSTQGEFQLTGCIVKVFNIPPSTTTNDILALCRPIGMVKEMKLNLPKENSVVIRFGEPTCAENFFSIYHGQKLNNYFLNVIVI